MQDKQFRLPVSEVFYSIQGEGQTMGVPSVFLRLGGCNILCQSKHWVCDTIEVWRKSKSTIFEEVLSEEFVEKLRDGAHLVITGGEPLIHQTNIVNFIQWYGEKHQHIPTIEVETNGTILPEIGMLKIVDFWNCSPKLSNSGEQNLKAIRVNSLVLNELDSMGPRTIFKFVVSNQDDIDEIFKDFSMINKNKIVLMPAGSSQEELNETRLFVAEKARDLGVRYSDRLHVVIWNLKTGV